MYKYLIQFSLYLFIIKKQEDGFKYPSENIHGPTSVERCGKVIDVDGRVGGPFFSSTQGLLSSFFVY